ncbi:hypothetical protein BWQ96_08021 [Gracilariopsis chorda]|uniref:Uncharacterized protein n=1 Tax=Gracilariopsis chorda TaxID=448386 RepID=A0A2V3IJM7_9FLOR|nr:hypothetical protein BWQ96_08021 [Gracilariopsis chorda]|eukprot:PXF42243.1 hypothetical protein BWQ96_08021 [Gracilariopsis chorda]
MCCGHQEDEIERVICHIAPVHTLRHSQQPSESERALVLVQDGDLSYCVPKRHFRLWAKYHARVQWDFENWPAGFEPELQPMDNGHFFFDLDEWANIRELAMVVMGADEGQIVCGCSASRDFTHESKHTWRKEQMAPRCQPT